MAETLVILLVTLVVFGPEKLPELAKQLGKIAAKAKYLKDQLGQLWHQQQLQFELEDNTKKAEAADKKYQALKSED
jgi:TatA/E family protein of Tat protein translocase